MKRNWLRIGIGFTAVFFIIISAPSLSAQSSGKALILQEMTWTDVRDYMKTSDMVIIPLGSTEQHGPHMPLGTDYYEALGVAKMISARTGVLIAPLLLMGYSEYHSGFQGTLSLKPETFEQVLFESTQMLMKYGFRRFMFFNYHGGNGIVQSRVIHRINHGTQAVAVAIGIGSPFAVESKEEAPFDWHAGIGETSLMLFLKPELVKMERAEKPKMRFTPEMEELKLLGEKDPALLAVWQSLFAVPVETRKGGASHELSSNGVWSMGDPRKATEEIGKREAEGMAARAVRFIETWKQARK